MAIKKLKPNAPKRRHATYDDFADLTKKIKPEKSLLLIKKKNSGRNNQGKITVRHQGGGHRRYIRLVDFNRDKFDIPATVKTIEYDPNRGARIALLNYNDGEKRYIIAPVGLKEGDTVVSSKELVEIKAGNAMPLKFIPAGVAVYNVEIEPGREERLLVVLVMLSLLWVLKENTLK
jgi:large subunit ribosomal protein L2